MTPNEVYESLIIKTNENAQTDNIALDRGRAVVLFREASNKFVEWFLEKKSDDDIRYLNPIVRTVHENEFEQGPGYQLFDLPKDFFDLGTVSIIASTSCCKEVKFDSFEIKIDNQEEVIGNELIKPSGEYREAPYYLENNKIKVFTDDFKVDEVGITYYKYPQYIELEDENDPESLFKDGDTPLEFDDKVLDRIITIAAADNNGNTNNPNAQLLKSRVLSKF